MQRRNYSEKDCQDLVTELQAYKSSSPPFNTPLGNLAAFKPKLWWQSLGANLIIVHLAVFLYDIVPHAATVERLFSLMGWFHNDRRNRLGVDSTGNLTAIKTFYEQKAPRCVYACIYAACYFTALQDWLFACKVHICLERYEQALAFAGLRKRPTRPRLVSRPALESLLLQNTMRLWRTLSCSWRTWLQRTTWSTH
jgi:hypothetical protein